MYDNAALDRNGNIWGRSTEEEVAGKWQCLTDGSDWMAYEDFVARYGPVTTISAP